MICLYTENVSLSEVLKHGTFQPCRPERWIYFPKKAVRFVHALLVEDKVMRTYSAGNIHTTRLRIQYDLYYIENWSLRLDLKILMLTFVGGFVDRNAY